MNSRILKFLGERHSAIKPVLAILVCILFFGSRSAAADENRPESKKLLLGVVLGIPHGAGISALARLNSHVAAGPYISSLTVGVKNGDGNVQLSQLGGRLRYHWKGLSPRGGYIFGDVALIRAEFQGAAGSGTEISSDKENAHITFGVGYQTLTQPVTFDIGLGLGTKTEFERVSSTGRTWVKLGGTLYGGLAWGF